MAARTEEHQQSQAACKPPARSRFTSCVGRDIKVLLKQHIPRPQRGLTRGSLAPHQLFPFCASVLSFPQFVCLFGFFLLCHTSREIKLCKKHLKLLHLFCLVSYFPIAERVKGTLQAHQCTLPNHNGTSTEPCSESGPNTFRCNFIHIRNGN